MIEFQKNYAHFYRKSNYFLALSRARARSLPLAVLYVRNFLSRLTVSTVAPVGAAAAGIMTTVGTI
jgi:hypothetical protein